MDHSSQQSSDEKKETSAEDADNTSDNEKTFVAAALAGLTKAVVYGIKSLPRTMVKATLHKQAFLALGRRTVNGTVSDTYRYDGKKVKAISKPTWRRQFLGRLKW